LNGAELMVSVFFQMIFVCYSNLDVEVTNCKYIFICYRTTSDTFCATDCSAIAGGDLRAINWTAQNSAANIIWCLGVSAAESWQPTWGEK